MSGIAVWAGDRVRHKDDRSATGVVLEIRDFGDRGVRARVDWDDENVPTWCGVQFLRPL